MEIDFAPDAGLQRSFGCIEDNFGIDAIITLGQAKDYGLSTIDPSALARIWICLGAKQGASTLMLILTRKRKPGARS